MHSSASVYVRECVCVRVHVWACVSMSKRERLSVRDLIVNEETVQQNKLYKINFNPVTNDSQASNLLLEELVAARPQIDQSLQDRRKTTEGLVDPTSAKGMTYICFQPPWSRYDLQF